MLNHLQIRDFAIIPAMALDIDAGFTTITGETGAGKSILVDALGLLLGARADISWVRQGAPQAELSAEFDISNNPAACQWLEEAQLAQQDQCLLRRVIAASGRSRAWINGSLVTVQQLTELGHHLVEIHGQNEHLRLNHPARQLQLLDVSGDYADALTKVSTACIAWRALDQQLRDLEEAAGLSPSERDYLSYQVKELSQIALSEEQLKSLELEHRKLASGGALVGALESAFKQLDDDDTGAVASLHRASAELKKFAELDDHIQAAGDLLAEAVINAEEATHSLSQALDRNEVNPERLQAVERQLTELADMARKHQVPMEALTPKLAQLEQRLSDSEAFAERRQSLQQDLDVALAEYRKHATALSKKRSQHAKRMSKEVSALMQELGMAGGVLVFALNHDDSAKPSEKGDDRVEIRVSANPGTAPAALAKVASGGELSRISLALKVAARHDNSGRSQVFDEVDAGIGGDTANAVGHLLQNIARHTQTLCVTHLAQVAVCADQQLQVRKQADQKQTEVATSRLSDDERVDEIARMLSGKISDQSRGHAEEMLLSARPAAQTANA